MKAIQWLLVCKKVVWELYKNFKYIIYLYHMLWTRHFIRLIYRKLGIGYKKITCHLINFIYGFMSHWLQLPHMNLASSCDKYFLARTLYVCVPLYHNHGEMVSWIENLLCHACWVWVLLRWGITQTL